MSGSTVDFREWVVKPFTAGVTMDPRPEFWEWLTSALELRLLKAPATDPLVRSRPHRSAAHSDRALVAPRSQHPRA